MQVCESKDDPVEVVVSVAAVSMHAAYYYQTTPHSLATPRHLVTRTRLPHCRVRLSSQSVRAFTPNRDAADQALDCWSDDAVTCRTVSGECM